MQQNDRLAAAMDFIMNAALISGYGRHGIITTLGKLRLSRIQFGYDSLEQFQKRIFNRFFIYRNGGQQLDRGV